MSGSSQNRRSFLRTAGGLALVGLCDPAGVMAGAWQSSSQKYEGPSRIAVFFEDGFPGVDHFTLDRDILTEALRQFEGSGVDFLTSAQLETGLTRSIHRLFINPYGSAFPESAWNSIRSFLSAGGNLLNLGGVPFSIPVARDTGTRWIPGSSRTTYHRELGITQSFNVETSRVVRYKDLSKGPDSGMQSDLQDAADLPDLLKVDGVHELYVRFTSTRDFPGEDGTSGQRDAEIHTEVGGFDPSGNLVVAPVIRIDRYLGEFAGGRWILANYHGGIEAAAIRELVRRAFGPIFRASVEPTFATYIQGETPAFRLHAPDPSRAFAGELNGNWSITLSDEAGTTAFHTTLDTGELQERHGGLLLLPGETARELTPGLYTVKAIFKPSDRKPGGAGDVSATNGFWIMDRKLLAAGAGLKAGERYFSRGEMPYPVVGTSYMSDGVQRKFLLEPNPVLWDRDFREMKQSGINMIRTGIWTGWKNIMLDTGQINEAPLRSLDAFVLTAARYDIPVIFTFFAFLPESWGGENPYFDPRAIQAQTIFLSTIARRYADAPGVIWDLINEPSFSSPEHLWSCRPNYDRHERKAWADWFDVMTKADGAHTVSERFRLSGTSPPPLPLVEDFSDRNIIGNTKPFLAYEYRRFAQEHFRRWAMIMSEALRRESGSNHLVTVGQDEGATVDRPSPHYFADEVDFTSMHNWWYNDDLLWDTLMTSVPGKTNLIGETGVMFYETAEGMPWRSEPEVRDLVEKKLAISFASGAAGFVNWLWNSNPYMDSDNEAGIGLKRADGTHKPEFDSVRRFSRFFSEHAPLMTEKEEEQAVMVIPHSNLFSNRNTATEATRACVRAMEYHCRVPLRAVSEYGLGRITEPPALIVVPSPVVFANDSWTRLKSLVDRGSTLLISGPFDRDPYYLPTGRMHSLGLSALTEPVHSGEMMTIDGREFRVGFRGEKIQRVEKSPTDGGAPASVSVLQSGKGRIVYSPIPIELSDSLEAVSAFYTMAIAVAGLSAKVRIDTDDPSVLVRPIVFEKAILMAFIPETGVVRNINFTLAESRIKHVVEVPAGRPLIQFYSRKDGSLISTLKPTSV